jgi:hypothetical protein
MANLNVNIVYRMTDPDGRRLWRLARGKDPSDNYYLQWYEGSRQKHTKAGDNYQEAELAQMRLERKLKATSQGFIVPEEPLPRRCTALARSSPHTSTTSV